jgi:hypothetical protein
MYSGLYQTPEEKTLLHHSAPGRSTSPTSTTSTRFGSFAMSNDSPSEYAECAALVDWLDRHGLTFTHVPLGGLRTQRSGAIMRRLGVRAGCPDYLIFDRPVTAPDARGVAVEMKRRRGATLSTAQRRFIATLEQHGWVVIVAYGAEQAVWELQRLGFGGQNVGGDAQT